MPELNFYASGDFNREVKESKSREEEAYRSPFRRDYARLIHAPAFRRLQRKTQLFPGDESDFFRNRLTHSLEVAQIAKSIASRLNYQIQQMGYETAGIDTDLIEFAGLAHDLGHPPFGHTGEYALDSRMRSYGGFEGNAQTLRILARSEKKRTKSTNTPFDAFVEFESGVDLRAGLNLTFRSLASIIKYDNEIPEHRENAEKPEKGYYASEKDLVNLIKRSVIGKNIPSDSMRTIEMQIMDIADDIAYSTYDLEDALKGGFTSPLDLLAQINNNEELRDAVAEKLFYSKLGRKYVGLHAAPSDVEEINKIKSEMTITVARLFRNFFVSVYDYSEKRMLEQGIDLSLGVSPTEFASFVSLTAQKFSSLIQNSSYNRIDFTSDLVGHAINSIDIEVNENHPCLSIVKIKKETRLSIDILKHLTYELQIRSPRLRVIESRGKQIVCDLFDQLTLDPDGDLLPSDWRARIRGCKEHPNFEAVHKRMVCDYIAGMSDAYALDAYARFTSSDRAKLFSPW